MKNLRTNILRGEQNTDIWKKEKFGKFSSSEIFKLFESPSKQSMAKAAMSQLKNDLWQPCKKMMEFRPTSYDLDYTSGYLVKSGFCKDRDVKAAKKEIKAVLKDDFFAFETIHNYDLTDIELLLIRGCYAIENIDILAGSAVGYAKQKHHEIIYQSLGEDLEGVKAIDWGNENEPLASKEFRRKTMLYPDEGENKVMIVQHLDIESVSSPDDTIYSLIPSEYKCPINKGIHHDHTEIRSGQDLFNFSKQKYYQVQHQIWSLKAEYGYWTSFHPDLLNRGLTAHKASHTIKIELNKDIARRFERVIKHATLIRDEFTRKFLETDDKGLY
jgi:hypothetical protein